MFSSRTFRSTPFTQYRLQKLQGPISRNWLPLVLDDIGEVWHVTVSAGYKEPEALVLSDDAHSQLGFLFLSFCLCFLLFPFYSWC